MNNLLSEIDKSFDEKFKIEYREGNEQWQLIAPRVDIKFFLHQAVKRAYEEGAKSCLDGYVLADDGKPAKLVSELNKE